MGDILVISRCKKKARMRTARVCDAYLPRVGDRTWRGYLSSAGIERLLSDLRKQASKKTGIALFALSRAHTSRIPLAVIGRKALSLPSDKHLCQFPKRRHPST